MQRKIEDKLNLLVVLVILVVLVGSYIGLSQSQMNWLIDWLVSITIGGIFSIIAGSIIESFTGDFLKKILINIKIINGLKFSISLFTIATIVLKFLLFNQI
jgi:hypothetical protein